jgi:hypothetical protein
LGREEETLKLHTFAKTEFNSLLPPSDYGADRFREYLSAASSETVEVRRLSDVFGHITAELRHPRVHLKVDAQGFDMEVIEGATGVLPRVTSLQTEVSLRPIYQGQPRMNEQLARLDELGFQPTGLFPVAFESDQLRVIEFDCVLLRRPDHDASSS